LKKGERGGTDGGRSTSDKAVMSADGAQKEGISNRVKKPGSLRLPTQRREGRQGGRRELGEMGGSKRKRVLRVRVDLTPDTGGQKKWGRLTLLRTGKRNVNQRSGFSKFTHVDVGCKKILGPRGKPVVIKNTPQHKISVELLL